MQTDRSRGGYHRTQPAPAPESGPSTPAPSAIAMPAAAAVAVAQWEWKATENVWKQYDAVQSDAIEAAYTDPFRTTGAFPDNP